MHEAASTQPSHPTNPSQPRPPSAFAVLTANAAAAFEAHHFFLGLSCGHWRAAIWPAGAPPPVWVAASGARTWSAVARVAMPQPGGAAKKSVELRLSTSAAVGGRGAAATAAGARLRDATRQVAPPGRERLQPGNVPLLKSALQVRPCRLLCSCALPVRYSALSLTLTQRLHRYFDAEIVLLFGDHVLS